MLTAWSSFALLADFELSVIVWLLFRYYGYMYSHWLPTELHNIVSQLQLCEDILFNFLVAHIVRHPPIKLTQRHNVDQSASSFPVHQFRALPPADGVYLRKKLATRQHCLNWFVKEFGYMPLLRSEVRYDPLLYKDNVSVLRKKYRHMENPAWFSAVVCIVLRCG